MATLMTATTSKGQQHASQSPLALSRKAETTPPDGFLLCAGKLLQRCSLRQANREASCRRTSVRPVPQSIPIIRDLARLQQHLPSTLQNLVTLLETWENALLD